MSFVDFAKIKETIPVEKAATLLSLGLEKHGNQFRGECPRCKSRNPRALVVTPGKGFYCFTAKTGGDVIGLVAHIQGVPAKDAALWLQGGRTAEPTVPPSIPELELDVNHESVMALGIDPSTAEFFAMGYCKTGIMRGKVAVPIHDPKGTKLAYMGLGTPLTFPKNFDPETTIFNAHRIKEGSEVYVTASPIHVIAGFDAGVDNVISVLTPTISPIQFRYIADILERKGCVGIFQ